MTTCIPRKSPTLSSFVPLGPSAGSKLPASDPNTICCLLLHVSGDVDAYGIPQAGLRRPCPTYLVRSPQRGYGKPIISSRSPVHPINIFPHGGVPSVHMTLRAQRNHPHLPLARCSNCRNQLAYSIHRFCADAGGIVSMSHTVATFSSLNTRLVVMHLLIDVIYDLYFRNLPPAKPQRLYTYGNATESVPVTFRYVLDIQLGFVFRESHRRISQLSLVTRPPGILSQCFLTRTLLFYKF